MIFDTNKSRYSDDYLSNSNIIYLEFIRPSYDYDDSYHQFKLFFTTFTPKLHIGLNDDLFICPIEYLIDCNDFYCVHSNARCNGISECRSKIDEDSCSNERSNGIHFSYFIINIKYIFIFIIISML
jgi:hypothetical protein